MINNIKALRKRAGLTREQLASRLETSSRMIQYLEEGERQLTEKWLQKLSKALGATISELVGEAAAPKADTSSTRTLALLLADALAQEKPAQIRAKLSDILDQQLKTLGIGMTPESFIKFVIESRQMGGGALPAPEKSKKKSSSD